jgi:hypothetical protein
VDQVVVLTVRLAASIRIVSFCLFSVYTSEDTIAYFLVLDSLSEFAIVTRSLDRKASGSGGVHELLYCGVCGRESADRSFGRPEPATRIPAIDLHFLPFSFGRRTRVIVGKLAFVIRWKCPRPGSLYLAGGQSRGGSIYCTSYAILDNISSMCIMSQWIKKMRRILIRNVHVG